MEDKLTYKEELVEKARQLAESTDVFNKHQELANLRKKWRNTLSEEESLRDIELQEKFNAYADQIMSEEQLNSQSIEERKKSIIEEAKKLVDSNSYKATTAKFEELKEELKSAGRLAKEVDDAFWAEFKEARSAFTEKKNAYFAGLKEKYEQNKVAKQGLIERAKEVVDMESIKEAGKKMEELMAEWKTLGNAGKDCNDDLWSQFSSLRNAFYKKRSEFNASMKQVYAERAEKKKDLIARAKKCLACHTFTEEEVNEIKAIRAEWKAIGNAGRDNEETLWNEFNETVNRYFDEKKVYGNNNY